MHRLDKIHQYLLEHNNSLIDIQRFDQSSVYLSMEIMEYAHKNQQRDNKEDFGYHPNRCMQNYRKLVGIIPNDPYCIDEDLLVKFHIPYKGVQEVCLLHDVLEYSDFNIEELEEIFKECKLDDYFNLYIKDALIRITHNPVDDYDTYILKVLDNPISSLVKILDMNDNANTLSLLELNNTNLDKTIKYIGYIYLINNKYHFIENIQKYKEEFNKDMFDLDD